MNNKKILLILILVFVIVLGGAYTLYTELESKVASEQLAVSQPQEQSDTDHEEKTEAKDRKAPDFLVYDMEGNEVRLYDYIGKPIVLNFWASWCGPCQLEMPDFNEKYIELGDEVQFLMVNMTDGSRETVDIASAFIEEKGYTFPVVYDTAGEAAMNYGAYSLPTTYFIDSNGDAIARATGAIDSETLQKGIDMIK